MTSKYQIHTAKLTARSTSKYQPEEGFDFGSLRKPGVVWQEVADEDEEREKVVDSPQGPQQDAVVVRIDAVYVGAGAGQKEKKLAVIAGTLFQ